MAANKAAVIIDEAYIAREKPVGIYPLAYYPHNVHSLMASAQMAGDGASAVGAAEKLARIVSADAARAVPMAQPIAAAHFYTHAQFSAPATVLALAAPADDLPFVKAMWHYARGVAYRRAKGRAGRPRGGGRHRSAQGEATIPRSPPPEFRRRTCSIWRARWCSRASRWRKASSRRRASAFEQAVAMQDRLTYSEPPFWYYPVGQSLAAVLLRLGELEAAEDAFRASLARAPNNGWALYGLSEVYRRMGRADAVAEVTRLLDEAWAGDRGTLDLERL